MPTIVNSSNFEQEVLKSELPILVDFWAEWCGPCKMVDPTIEALAKEREGKLRFGKLNVDESSDVAAKFGVMSIPTYIIFKGGQKIGSFVGALPKESFEKHVDEILAQVK
jgi:thioredoxin 1